MENHSPLDSSSLRHLALNYLAALLGVAAAFDALYLITTPGHVLLAAAYSLPLLAGALGGILVAATESHWPNDRLAKACLATLTGGLGNTTLVLAVSGILQTGATDWLRGITTVILSALTPAPRCHDVAVHRRPLDEPGS